ncbi:anaerobic ribonucleoside triphosphate reductase [Thermococcus sp. GR7]|uniref:anaerobic ribonucleoside triphosphate reductase n=1 Tax=unclassified Thermococcus TaxID=2627626 RepID=UPI0014316DF5|nr:MULTISPECIES: anaerobic ribonucleoside triphosphate reductase [unclassified Thermococcus]NJE45898.1 anaerobic ribonucleoside triphosphate reductase [Thermococcus sp. GR7]NJE78789.1 anaerobic ribonucleoside triphosphate reductase [Thermococcus sp. GR4]NJF22093.1 anaerobic ribonucleoside triphosphate reductase [Thermococcus sp. GR5]
METVREDIIQEYTRWGSLDVLENANRYPGPTGFFAYVMEEALKEHLSLIPTEGREAHFSGDIYIHKLPYSLYIPYCTGHSTARLLEKGLKTPTIISRPAKHFDTYVDHIANYLITMQHYFSGAQALSSVEWYAGPFIRKEGLDRRKIRQNIQRLVYNLNYPSRVGMQCLSEDTVILTPYGWRRYDEVNVGDVIYTFNVETKSIEPRVVRHVHVSHYSGKMYNLRNRTQDQLISPRHRVVRKVFNSDRYTLTPIEEVLKFKSPIPVPTPAITKLENDGIEMNEEWIKLLAWILSEGSIEKRSKGTSRVTIVQSPESHPEEYREILELLSKLGLGYTIRDDPGWGNAKAIRLNAESSKIVVEKLRIKGKKPPLWLYQLNREQAKVFIETYVKGDGYTEKGENRVRITTTDEEMKDAIVAVAVLAGYNVSVSVRTPNPPSKKAQYIVTLTATGHEYIQEIKEVEYSGIIWSVNTENETVIAMRKGSVFITGNTPFTNFTVTLDAPKEMLEGDHAVYDGKKLEPLGEYEREAKEFFIALTEVLREGDAIGQPFTFPIPTLMVTAKMLWDDPEVFEAVFTTAAKRGSFYWLNTNVVDPDASYAMCCRIAIDKTEMAFAFGVSEKSVEEEAIEKLERQRFGGLWAMPDVTGSVNVTTVNLPRLALKANGDDDKFWEEYERVLQVVRDTTDWFRERYVRLITNYRQMYQMIHLYLEEFPSSHFNTIGILGLPEAAAIYLNEPGLWTEGTRKDWLKAAELMKEMVEFATARAREWMKESWTPWNVEEVPGESAAAKLAIRDLREFPWLKDYLSDVDNPIYSTSIAPYYGSLELGDRIRIEEKVQRSFTGGVMMHIFLGEEPDPEALAKLTKRLMKTDLVYWSYTPAVTVCNDCNHSTTGLHTHCQRCGSENVEIWSRIIGYYRPLKNWNPFRKKEFWTRRHYTS